MSLLSLKLAVAFALLATSVQGLRLQTGTTGQGNSTVAAEGNSSEVPIAALVPVPVIVPIPVMEKPPTTTEPAPLTGPMRKPYKCEDIHDVFSCRRALLLFGFDCVGFGGNWCVPATGAKCSDFTDGDQCGRAQFEKSHGLECFWNGVTCVRSVKCEHFRNGTLCNRAITNLGHGCFWTGWQCIR